MFEGQRPAATKSWRRAFPFSATCSVAYPLHIVRPLIDAYRRARLALAWVSDRVAESIDRQLLAQLGRRTRFAARATTTLRVAGNAAAWTRLPPRLDTLSLTADPVLLVIRGQAGGEQALATTLGIPRWTTRTLERQPAAFGWRHARRSLPGVGWCVTVLPPGARSLGALTSAPYSVTVRSTVGHLVDLGTPFSLDGKERKGLRQSLGRLDRHDVSADVTRERRAFDEFHDLFYRPHILNRHRTTAIVVDRERQWTQWFGRGGALLQVRVDGTIAISGIVFRTGDCVALVEEGTNGALEAEPYFGALQAALKRAAIEWARSTGATSVYLGMSPAAAAHGIYRSKRLWGARLILPPRVMDPCWTFQANELSARDRELVNGRRLVTFVSGVPAVVQVIGSDGAPGSQSPADDDLAVDGFHAVVLVGRGSQTVRHLGRTTL